MIMFHNHCASLVLGWGKAKKCISNDNVKNLLCSKFILCGQVLNAQVPKMDLRACFLALKKC